MTNTLKLGQLLIAIYGVLVLINAGFYAWWSNDFGELHRAIIRVGGVALLIYGLVNKANWAWWLAVLGTGVLFMLGGIGVIMALSNDMFANRPYATIDMAFLFSSIGVLALAFFTFLLPSTRREIKKPKKI